MAKYEFTIDIPMYLPQSAIDELKSDIKEKLDELTGRCTQYEVKAKVNFAATQSKEVEESKEEEEEEEA